MIQGSGERVDIVDNRNAGAVIDIKGCLDYEYMYDEMIFCFMAECNRHQ